DDNIYVGGGIKSGAMTFKAAYGEGKRSGAAKEKQTTVGVDYSLGKKTAAYLMWNEDQNAAHAVGGSAKAKATVIGITTDF
ncbi:MAG: porin, partial [Thiothrix sp.]